MTLEEDLAIGRLVKYRVLDMLAGEKVNLNKNFLHYSRQAVRGSLNFEQTITDWEDRVGYEGKCDVTAYLIVNYVGERYLLENRAVDVNDELEDMARVLEKYLDLDIADMDAAERKRRYMTGATT